VFISRDIMIQNQGALDPAHLKLNELWRLHLGDEVLSGEIVYPSPLKIAHLVGYALD
jgi:hypothetical protein